MNFDEALDFRAKNHHIIRSLVILIGIIVITFIKAYIDQRNDLKDLRLKLLNRDIILIPASSQVVTARLNQISNKDVKSEALYIINMLGNVSADTIEGNYLEIARKMPERIRAIFLENSRKKIKYIRENNIKELVDHYTFKLLQTGPYHYRITVQLSLNVIINNSSSGLKEEVLEFDLLVRGPTKLKRWFFELVTFKRLSPSGYEKLKGVK